MRSESELRRFGVLLVYKRRCCTVCLFSLQGHLISASQVSCEAARPGRAGAALCDADNEGTDRCLGDRDGSERSLGLIMLAASPVTAEPLSSLQERLIFMCNTAAVTSMANGEAK